MTSLLATIISLGGVLAWEQQNKDQDLQPANYLTSVSERTLTAWETTEIESTATMDVFNRSRQSTAELTDENNESTLSDHEPEDNTQQTKASETNAVLQEQLSSHLTSTEPAVTTTTVAQTQETIEPIAVEVDEAQFAKAVLDRVNQVRKDYGLSSLMLDQALEQCARIRVSELTTLASHDRPDGTPFYTCLVTVPYEFSAAGENFAISSEPSSAADIVNAWLDSPGHRKNILNPSFTKMGFGILDEGGRCFYEQLFVG